MPEHPGKGPSSRELGLILGAALLLRALCLIPAATHPERFLTLDSPTYLALARDLSAGYLDTESATFTKGLVRTPGYPVFLGVLFALLRGSLAAVVAAQLLVSLATVWLTCVLGARLAGRRTAIASGLLVAFDPVSTLFACLIQPETLFTGLLVAAAICWLTALEQRTWKLAALAGLLLGLAAMTRPIGVFLPLGLAFTPWLPPRAGHRIRLALCMLLAAGAPIGGWMVKNQILTRFPVFSTAGDSGLLEYRAAGALAEDQGLALDDARALVWQRLLAITPPATSVAELSSRKRALAFEVLAEHPVGAIRMSVRGLFRMMSGTGLTALSNLLGDQNPEEVSSPWKRIAQGVAALGLGLVYLAVGRGVVLLIGRRELLALALTAGVIGYLALLSAGPEANTRFRFPATPFLAILAGIGLSASFARSRPN